MHRKQRHTETVIDPQNMQQQEIVDMIREHLGKHKLQQVDAQKPKTEAAGEHRSTSVCFLSFSQPLLSNCVHPHPLLAFHHDQLGLRNLRGNPWHAFLQVAAGTSCGFGGAPPFNFQS